MVKKKLTLDRFGCIGCNTCETVAPNLFFVNRSDMKSDIIKKGAVVFHKGDESKETHELELSEEDVHVAKEAESTCPVNVIHYREDE